ncbi:MAG TPA: IPT/TIG domain-containing protein [Archangium sp.]|uniref:IPT/TIG domain-containing protein n=1 Tax=Archangium sp. TaxID=1872627 RepID=UPI002E3782C4|nr:IPT/TIG domain-containing protein [Archangium sp.]HEX5745076.1 IPT/TIG domain-containing protein [Archangium sp.]
MLVKFIHDLTTNEKLQRAFAENPKKTMKQAGLSAKHQNLIKNRDPRQVSQALMDELRTSPFIGFWFVPAINLTSISPASGRQGQTLEVTLTGQYFTDPMTADIENNTQKVPITLQEVTGAGEAKSQATGTLALAANLPPGPYTVRVTSNQDATSTLSMGFTVNASSGSKRTATAAKKSPARKASGAKTAPARKTRAKTPKK